MKTLIKSVIRQSLNTEKRGRIQEKVKLNDPIRGGSKSFTSM